jgi:hypothetical protein
MNLTIIQQLLAPVVMISACGLLCLALFNRLATIVARIRQFNRERLDQNLRRRGAAIAAQRAMTLLGSALERQIPRMLHRARLIHRALIGLVSCVICMLISSLGIGLAHLEPAVLSVAIGCFVLGIGCMLGGMSVALRELTISLADVELEARVLDELPPPSESERGELLERKGTA